MIARHLSVPHRFICVADTAEGLDPSVEFFETPPEAALAGKFRNPEGPRFPSCYRRLWMFSEEAKILGDRVSVIDIDLVAVAEMAPIFDRTEDFVGWRPFRDWGAKLRFGGGIYLLKTGSRTKVWNEFNAYAIKSARKAGFRGSDQAWISFRLGKREPYWDRASGIYSIRDFRGKEEHLPKDARLVQMNGPSNMKPWNSNLKWVKQHWQ